MDSLIHLTSVAASNLTEHLSNNEWMLDHASLEIILVEYFLYNTEHCRMLVRNMRQRRKQKFKLSIGGRHNASKNVNAVCNMGSVPPVRSTRKNSIIELVPSTIFCSDVHDRSDFFQLILKLR